jgi:hypothetical protein
MDGARGGDGEEVDLDGEEVELDGDGWVDEATNGERRDRGGRSEDKVCVVASFSLLDPFSLLLP